MNEIEGPNNMNDETDWSDMGDSDELFSFASDDDGGGGGLISLHTYYIMLKKLVVVLNWNMENYLVQLKSLKGLL